MVEVKKIVIPVTQVLSVTWLIWLYSNTSILSIANLAPTQRSPFLATMQPLQPGLDSMSQLTHWIQPLITPAPVAEPDQTWLEVRLSKRQVTLFRGDEVVRSYPIAVGQAGWETPKGQFRVLNMLEKPDWIHPLTKEKVLNTDSKNPLGRFWIGFWTDGANWVGFHGTPEEKTVGQALSHGCLRMLDPHIDELYYQVSTGTPVIVKQ